MGKILKRALAFIGALLTILLTTAASLLCFSIKWMFDTWSNLSMDELVFHLTAPLEGTNEGMIREYISLCVAPTVLILLSVLIMFLAFRHKKKYYIVMGAGIVLALGASGITVKGAWDRLDVEGYTRSQGTYSTFIDEYYVDPAEVQITFPEQKRNLIYIFLESMETTYADKESGGAFEENVIPELTRLAQENEDFSGEDIGLNGGYAMPGTTWTMGGIFAQTAGLPLNISIEANSMDTQETFFAGATTLGDILEQEGYSQMLIIGSDATFGGRKLYFTSHGDYNIVDYYYAVEQGWIPEDYSVWWGYEDEKLFTFAKEKVLELAAQDQPFNLTLLTVDTHFEDGYLCNICPDTYDNQYANVMACSSKQVYKFLKWIQQQEFYENTTIILAGDHLTMDSDFCEGVDGNYVRRTYTAYINSAAEPELNQKREYTTFDQFPTTLASLGIEIEGNHLGLGTNLFSDTQTLTERFGRDDVAEEVKRKSRFMEKLANLDENNQELMVREGRAPTANVWADAYQFQTGALPVTVENITNMQNGIVTVMIAVWTEEDQSDLQWIPMEANEAGNYHVNVNVPNFNYKTGEYHIQAYVIDNMGEQHVVGETVGIVN